MYPHLPINNIIPRGFSDDKPTEWASIFVADGSDWAVNDAATSEYVTTAPEDPPTDPSLIRDLETAPLANDSVYSSSYLSQRAYWLSLYPKESPTCETS